MSGQGSTSNVIAALASFFLPGLGQLIQGRVGAAVLHALFLGLPGWIFSWVTFGISAAVAGIISAIGAARWKGPRE